MTVKTADVIIVGGGVHGASTAYELAKAGVTVAGMADATRKDYGYTVFDTDSDVSDDVAAKLQGLDGVIRVRVLG